MATQIQGKALLQNTHGIAVYRAAAAVPSNTTGSIFNVNGGRVRITQFFGEITTIFSSAGATFTVNATNTASGGSFAVATVSSSQTTTGVGNLASMPTVGGTLAFGNGLVAVPGFILKPGAIQVVTSAVITGAMSWFVTYLPLDPGASVTAA